MDSVIQKHFVEVLRTGLIINFGIQGWFDHLLIDFVPVNALEEGMGLY